MAVRFTTGIIIVQVQRSWVHYAQMKEKCNYFVQVSSADHYGGLQEAIRRLCML
jgi:hypothetical protein